MGEIDTEDENRLWEEAEAKRRAEFAKKIKEEAEASAKRRAEEDRLWEEAWAKRKAEVEKKRREEAEATRRIEKNKGFSKAREEKAKRKADEEKRIKEEAEAKRRAEEENRIKKEAAVIRKAEEENRIKKEAATKRKAEEEKRRKEKAETTSQVDEGKRRTKEIVSKRRDEEENRLNEEAENQRNTEATNRPRPVAEVNSETEEAQQEKNADIKKKVLWGSLAAVIAIIGIWAFSNFIGGPEEQSPSEPKIEATVLEDPIVLEKSEIDSPTAEEALLKLAVGDIYEGGFVFAIDPSGNTGKIAHIDDAGPMPWQNAMKIHEQLGEGWRLPTFDELQTMYRNIGQGTTNIGEFSDGLYWSATAYDEYQARLLRFRDANTSYHYNKNVEHRQFRVRAVRDISR